VAEPGARVGALGGLPAGVEDEPTTPEDLMASGLLDSVVSREALRGFLSRLMDLITNEAAGPRPAPVPRPEPALPSARAALAAARGPWGRRQRRGDVDPRTGRSARARRRRHHRWNRQGPAYVAGDRRLRSEGGHADIVVGSQGDATRTARRSPRSSAASA